LTQSEIHSLAKRDEKQKRREKKDRNEHVGSLTEITLLVELIHIYGSPQKQCVSVSSSIQKSKMKTEGGGRERAHKARNGARSSRRLQPGGVAGDCG
jgi:hypothetical protein